MGPPRDLNTVRLPKDHPNRFLNEEDIDEHICIKNHNRASSFFQSPL